MSLVGIGVSDLINSLTSPWSSCISVEIASFSWAVSYLIDCFDDPSKKNEGTPGESKGPEFALTSPWLSCFSMERSGLARISSVP